MARLDHCGMCYCESTHCCETLPPMTSFSYEDTFKSGQAPTDWTGDHQDPQSSRIHDHQDLLGKAGRYTDRRKGHQRHMEAISVLVPACTNIVRLSNRTPSLLILPARPQPSLGEARVPILVCPCTRIHWLRQGVRKERCTSSTLPCD